MLMGGPVSVAQDTARLPIRITSENLDHLSEEDIIKSHSVRQLADIN